MEHRGRDDARPLPVVFALHDATGTYWLNTAVALTSVAQHASRPVRFYLLHDETLGDTARRRLGEIAAAMACELTFVAETLPPGIDPAQLRTFSPASTFRLSIPRLWRDEPLVVYLDSDLVLNGVDIHQLADSVPETAPLSAVADPFARRYPAEEKAKLASLGVDCDRYFNTGVLALRPPLLPSDLMAQFIDFVQRNAPLHHPDQDFLNALFSARAHLLDPRFNTVVGYIERRLVRRLDFYAGKIVHYAGLLKPLSGAVSPAFIPFLVHAHRTPEIFLGAQYVPEFYLFPMVDNADTLRGKNIFRDPGG